MDFEFKYDINLFMRWFLSGLESAVLKQLFTVNEYYVSDLWLFFKIKALL